MRGHMGTGPSALAGSPDTTQRRTAGSLIQLLPDSARPSPRPPWTPLDRPLAPARPPDRRTVARSRPGSPLPPSPPQCENGRSPVDMAGRRTSPAGPVPPSSRMRSLPSLLFGALIGAGVSTGLWLTLGRRQPPGPGPVTTPDPARPASDASTGDSERLRRIEAQLARLTGDVAELRERAEGAAARAALDAAPPQAPGPVDEAALAAALQRGEERRELERLAALSDQQLLDEARRRGKDDPLEEEALLESLLDRPLSTQHRAQALAYLGVLHRKGGDLAASEEALLEAATVAGDTDEGAWATYELATTIAEGGDRHRALALVRPVPDRPGISDWHRLHAEWITASLEAETGDASAARARYEDILAECEGTDFDWLAQRALRQLDALR